MSFALSLSCDNPGVCNLVAVFMSTCHKTRHVVLFGIEFTGGMDWISPKVKQQGLTNLDSLTGDHVVDFGPFSAIVPINCLKHLNTASFFSGIGSDHLEKLIVSLGKFDGACCQRIVNYQKLTRRHGDKSKSPGFRH